MFCGKSSSSKFACLSQALSLHIHVHVIHLLAKKRVLECMNGSSGKTIAPVLHLLPDFRLCIQWQVYSDLKDPIISYRRRNDIT